MAVLRRPPEAIIAAHRIDPTRRELFVEGRRDRTFLEFLVPNRDVNTRVIEISHVDLPTVTSGGERGRLLHFAEVVAPSSAQIRVFADADWDRVFERAQRENCDFTDFRDLEGYVLTDECVATAAELGLGVSPGLAIAVLHSALAEARRVAMLRIASERLGLRLPFQRVRWRRLVVMNGTDVHVDFERLVDSLLANAGSSSSAVRETLLKQVEDESGRYAANADLEIVHGKDVVALLEVGFLSLSRDFTPAVLWASFRADSIPESSALASIASFLKGA